MLNVDYVDFPLDTDAHDWSDWEVTKQATTTEPGETTRTCKNDPSHVEIKYTPRLNPYRVADMIDNLKKPYDKAEVEEVCGAYKRLVESGKYSIEPSELAKLQTAVDSLAKAETTTLKSVKAKKGKKAVVQWKKNVNVNGYQLHYKAAGTKAKTVTVNSNKTLKKTVKKLKAGKKYTFKVRTFSTVENLSTGKMKTVYSAWSKTKKVKAKK
ncbi:MAG: fibronectin type III domain-containing protein [Firmicutes bacterium]|nr:fibronectin type III domain-containing protein [Bacillota bacterium]